MQKTEFLNPEVELIEFEAEDVITTSIPHLDYDGTDNDKSDNIDVDNLIP